MRRMLAAVALVVSCRSAEGEIVLDAGVNCPEVAVATLAAPLLPGLDVRDVAADGPNLSTGWALVDSGGSASLHRFGETAALPIDLFPPFDVTDDLRLLPGPEPGRALLIRETPGGPGEPGELDALVIDSAVPGGIAAHGYNLDNYPPEHMSDWHRAILYAERIPHIVAVPPAVDGNFLDVYVARLSPELALGNDQRLRLKLDCDAEDEGACDMADETYIYPTVDVIAAGADPRSRGTLLIHRLRTARESSIAETGTGTGGDGPPDSDLEDVVVLEIAVGEDDSIQGIITSQGIVGADVSPPPAATGVATDLVTVFALWESVPGGPQLFRLDRLDLDLEPFDRYAPTHDSQLLQLDGDIALGRITGGRWIITKVIEPPIEFVVTEHAAGEGGEYVAVRNAGPASFMLDRADGSIDLVQARCVE